MNAMLMTTVLITYPVSVLNALIHVLVFAELMPSVKFNDIFQYVIAFQAILEIRSSNVVQYHNHHHHQKSLIHVYHRHVDQIVIVVSIMLKPFALVYQIILANHHNVDLNV